jgi:hypothetical protein
VSVSSPFSRNLSLEVALAENMAAKADAGYAGDMGRELLL